MKMIKSERIPIYFWLDTIEPDALEQAKNLANLPFAFRHVALMPDCHVGYGMPIGGVLATNNTIIPNAVGVDIGCGMYALRTSLRAKAIKQAQFKKVLSRIKEEIPVGPRWRKNSLEKEMPSRLQPMEVVDRFYEEAGYQLGTLGGGNHFIEFQCDQEGFLWLMIHSGSRNLGKQVADYYNKEAQKILHEKGIRNIPKDLAHLDVEAPVGKAYIREMNYCIAFADKNRQLMATSVLKVLQTLFGEFSIQERVSSIHNYASLEEHYDTEVWVHRKGAIASYPDTLGVIPGSQGTSSYIVRSTGNRASFHSSAHGAGRKMGRREAQRKLNLKEEIQRMDEKGIVHSIRTKRDLDEASSAYKDIEKIIALQSDWTTPVFHLQPLAVLKG